MMGQVSAERTTWLVLCAGILAWKLLLPGFIEMADNGDFGKVAGPLCLASAEPEQENFFHFLYIRSKANYFDAHLPASELAIAWLASSAERTPRRSGALRHTLAGRDPRFPVPGRFTIRY
jgi:hypothetical protein